MNSIFSESHYINPYEYYFAQLGKIPSRIIFKEIKLTMLLKLLKAHDSLSLEAVCSTQAYQRKKDSFLQGVSLFKINENIFLGIISPPYGELSIEILYLEKESNQEIIEELKSVITSCLKKKDDFKGQLHMMSGSSHFYFEKFDIKPPKIELSLNYNDDFEEIDKLINQELSKKDNKGIVILHGASGTGKTFYIRHLINNLKKQKLYIPPNLAEQIASPSFINVLEDNSNSILIIEDAENILEKRSAHSGSAVSNLLNLSDGLLADCFNIQIICTFNSPLANIDEALLRKGRLIAQYEFKELEIHKAQKLSNSLGNTDIINKPMTLSEVYNLKSETGVKVAKKKMGFGRTQ